MSSPIVGTAGIKEPGLGRPIFFLVTGVSLVLLGFDPEMARQTFSDTLAGSVDAIERGSALRQAAAAMLGAWAFLALMRGSGRQLSWRPLLAIPLCVFLTIALLSPVWALDSGLSTRRVGLLFLLLLAAFALARIADMDQLARLALMVSSVVVALAVFGQFAFGSFDVFNGEWRLAGFLHPVALSWYCCLGILAAIHLALGNPRLRRVSAVVVVTFVGALVLTRTRTGIAALCVGVLILVFFQWKDRRRLITALSLSALGLAVMGVVVAGAVGLTWSGAYADIVEATSLGRSDAVSQIATFTGRLPVWETSIGLFEQRPVLGFGYNAFSSPDLLGLFAVSSGWVPSSSHSGFVDVLLSTGLVGASAFVVTLIGGLIVSSQHASEDRRFGLFAAVLGWLTINLVVESAVMFEANFVSLLVLTFLAKLAFYSSHHTSSGEATRREVRGASSSRAIALLGGEESLQRMRRLFQRSPRIKAKNGGHSIR